MVFNKQCFYWLSQSGRVTLISNSVVFGLSTCNQPNIIPGTGQPDREILKNTGSAFFYQLPQHLFISGTTGFHSDYRSIDRRVLLVRVPEKAVAGDKVKACNKIG